MENQNSVCFVARINEVKPIEGADNIELGVIGGWNCIIKKGEYTEGDLVVVATTDAVIPQEYLDATAMLFIRLEETIAKYKDELFEDELY